ncbi:MAG: GFA family protein [Sphingomonas sp.]|nr:GFA family protein [Sphingomonas sp.]
MGSDKTVYELSGKCLCGVVTITARFAGKRIEACHCTQCRTWGGGAYLATPMTDDFTIEGEEYVARFPSSAWAERGFCKRCGSNLFYHYLPAQQRSFLAGLFPGLDDGELHEEIFVDQKPDYYCFAGERERLTRAQVIEKFGIELPD